jgi:hypothetical protein
MMEESSDEEGGDSKDHILETSITVGGVGTIDLRNGTEYVSSPSSNGLEALKLHSALSKLEQVLLNPLPLIPRGSAY